MNERRMQRLLLNALDRDEHLQDALIAADAGRASDGEVEDEAARAHAAWVELERQVSEKARDAQKRLMVFLTTKSAA